jgi:cell division protein FtsL
MTAFIALADPRSGARREFTASPVRIGRDPSFELTIAGEGAGVVSGTHAILEHDGKGWQLTDLGSRNGTYLNDTRLAADVRTPVAIGAVIRLGETGPQFRVVAVHKSGVAATMVESAASLQAAVTRPMVAAPTPAGPSPSASEGPGMRTIGFQRQLAEERQKAKSGMRTVLVGAAVLVVVAGAGAVTYTRLQARAAQQKLADREAEIARQAQANDSLRQVVQGQADQLATRLAAAESAGGNAPLLDSLRTALASATQRTAELESELQRASKAVALQAAAADSARKAAQAEIDRLKAALAGGAKGALAAKTRDSLQKRLDAVQAQATEADKLDAKVKAGLANLAQLAQANAPAVGIVTGWFGTKGRTVSGVVVTASGVMLVGRSALRDGEAEPDSIEVSLGGARKSLWASEIAVPDGPGPDVAIIQLDDYTGPYVKKVDWKGASLKEGDATAIIGMPTGVNAGAAARPVVAAGVLGAVGGDQLGFDATTAIGASGSALFNAQGELVALSSAKASKGWVGVPLKPVRKLLPEEMRKELGL